MAMTIYLRQKLTILFLCAAVTLSAHLLYAYLKPQWINFHYAESLYAKKRWQEAIYYYNKSFDQGLATPTLLARLANANSQIKNYPQALIWYEEYLKLKPKDIWARRAYAGTLTGAGEFEKAAQEYKKMIQESKTSD